MRIGQQGLIPNPNGSIKNRFTCRFLWALKKLKKNKKPFSYHKVKIAAYSSMASAVGSTRTWSQVLLRRIRSRQRSRAGVVLRRKSRRRRRRSEREGINNEAKHKKKRLVSGNDGDEGISKLRELVPGGEIMGYSNLLDESAHYIKCLNMQIWYRRIQEIKNAKLWKELEDKECSTCGYIWWIPTNFTSFDELFNSTSVYLPPQTIIDS